MLSSIKFISDHTKVVGYTINDRRVVYESDIIDFARLSGDLNPIHMDELFASESIFKKRVAHGMFIASFFSKILGDEKYGYSGIYLSQHLNFLKPVYINDTVDIVIVLDKIDDIRSTFTFKTMCLVDGKVVIDGSAEIFIKKSAK